MIRQDAGSVSPSPRFAESAQQNGERAGVRCFVFKLTCYAILLSPLQNQGECQDAPRVVRRILILSLPLRGKIVARASRLRVRAASRCPLLHSYLRLGRLNPLRLQPNGPFYHDPSGHFVNRKTMLWVDHFSGSSPSSESSPRPERFSSTASFRPEERTFQGRIFKSLKDLPANPAAGFSTNAETVSPSPRRRGPG